MKIFIPLIVICFVLTSCEKLIEIDLPKDQVANDRVFANDANALQAISGLYQRMGAGNNFASGGGSSVTMLAGLSSDELYNYYPYDTQLIQFETNVLLTNNAIISTQWSSAYEVIYQANAIIEGLNVSVNIVENTKKQLLGEAYFIRAFTHFYLTNLYGDVPIVLTTDYRTNSIIAKQSKESVHKQVIKDLELAKSNLPAEYASIGRVRPNKSTAIALLARVYLYQENWSLAEQEATAILENDALYSLAPLKDVFLDNSPEAIWQLMPSNGSFNTYEGNTFIQNSGPESFMIKSELVNSFEPGDGRAIEWMDSIPYPDPSTILYYPSKYKIKTGATLTEYSMIFRLAEQYLIRAEARAEQGKLESAIEDIDKLRMRASLPLITDINPSISKENLLAEILHERRVELFTEWGHRWFDLKRTNTASQILGALKPTWSNHAQFYPIPHQELNNNLFFGGQNEGY